MRKFILVLLLSTPLFAQNIIPPVSNAKNSYTIENTAYKLGFAENYGIPVWELHTLAGNMLVGGAAANETWKTDSRVKGHRLSEKDFDGQKLEPVQLFPKTHAMNDTVAQETSFYTSNLVFMNKQLKESIWDRITASFEALAKKYGPVYIYSGTIFDKDPLKVKYIFNNHVAVPSHFYRMILYFSNGKAVYKCYRIANRIPTDYERTCDIEEYSYNLYQLEADTSLDFFDREIDAHFRQDKMKYLEKRVK